MPENKWHLKWCFGAHETILVTWVYELEKQNSCKPPSVLCLLILLFHHKKHLKLSFSTLILSDLNSEGVMGRNSQVNKEFISFGLCLDWWTFTRSAVLILLSAVKMVNPKRPWAELVQTGHSVGGEGGWVCLEGFRNWGSFMTQSVSESQGWLRLALEMVDECSTSV